MMTKNQSKEQKLKQEIKSWKETCEVVGDKETLNSIKISLQQIAGGKGIPLAQL